MSLARARHMVSAVFVLIVMVCQVLAAEPFDAAAVRRGLAEQDFRTLELPEGAEPLHITAVSMNFTLPLKVRPALERVMSDLKGVGWKEVSEKGGTMVTDEYGQAMLVRDGFLLSASVSPAGDDKGKAQVRLGNHGPVDSRTLPRPEGAKPLAEFGHTTILVVPRSVNDVADACRKILRAAGWQEYGPADTFVSVDPDRTTLTFRYGPVAVSAYISVAPAQGGKTTVQYATSLLARELPWPSDVAMAEFNEEPALVRIKSESNVDTMVNFYRDELKAQSYWMNAVCIDMQEDYARIVFSTDNDEHVLLKVDRVKEGGSKVDLSSLSKDDVREMALRDEPPAMPEEPQVAETPKPNVRSLPLPASAKNVEYIEDDDQIRFTSKEGVKPITKFFKGKLSGGEWDAEETYSVDSEYVASFELTVKEGPTLAFSIVNTGIGDDTEVTITVDGMSFDESQVAPADDMPAEEVASDEPAPESDEPLRAEDQDGLPLPHDTSGYGNETTPFRRVLTSNSPSALDKVVAFYREQLAEGGWKEAAKLAKVTDDSAQLAFDGPKGRLDVTLKWENDATTIELATRDRAAAKKAGVLPKPGQAKVVFANASEKSAKVTFGGTTISLKAGVGVEKLDGPSFEVKPGKYSVKVEFAGQKAVTETVQLGADQTWGVMVAEEGVLPMRAY